MGRYLHFVPRPDYDIVFRIEPEAKPRLQESEDAVPCPPGLRGGMKMKNGFPVKEMTIGGIDISEYAIIYPKDGSVSLRKAAELLARMIPVDPLHGGELHVPIGRKPVSLPVLKTGTVHLPGALRYMELSSMQRINGKREGDDGINVEYALFVHTLSILLDEPHQVDYQPCLSDEKVYRKILSNVRKKLDENPYASIISVSQNDSYAAG